ncbi:MAG: DUF3352 domain-containing protein [Gaiellaceae bacterium]|jgi:hypothetical protein
MKRWLTVGLVAAAFLAAGCGGTTSSPASAADIVPASAPVFLALDTDRDSTQWQQVNALAGAFPDKQHAVDSFKRSLSEDGLDWDDDLEPALGSEVDLVMLDFAHPDHTVGLLQPRDEAAFERAVERGNKHGGSEQVFYETFRGWTVVANSQAAIDAFEQASDRASKTLSDDATFRAAMNKAGDGLVRAYVNGAKAMAAIRSYMGVEAERYFKRLGTLDWLTTVVRAKKDGIGWDTTVHGTPGSQLEHLQMTPSNGSLERFVPKDALLYLAFHGTKGMFDGVADNPVLQQPGFSGLGKVFEQLGQVLQGENAVYVRGAGGSYPEATLVAAPGKGVDGAAALDKVIARFSRDLGAKPQRRTIAGVPARVLGVGKVSLLYANVGGKLVVTNGKGALAFAKNGGATVAESTEYARASRSSALPPKPQAVLYVDIHSTIPAFERIANTRIPDGIRRNLQPLRSAVEYAVGRTHELQVSFFLRIQ